MKIADIIGKLGVLKDEFDPKAFSKLNKVLPLNYVGAGEFRSVYQIVGKDLVVKLPKDRDDIEHSRIEYQRWHDIMHQRGWFLLRKYMPKIYYFNPKNGVLLMRFYKTAFSDVLTAPTKIENDIKWLQHLVATVCRDNCIGESFEENEIDWVSDIGIGNVGVTPKGEYKFIDMGLFEIDEDVELAKKSQRYASET